MANTDYCICVEPPKWVQKYLESMIRNRKRPANESNRDSRLGAFNPLGGNNMTIDMGKPIKTWVYVQKNPGMGTCGHLLNAGDTVHAIRYPYFTYTECPACAETTEKIEREKASK